MFACWHALPAPLPGSLLLLECRLCCCVHGTGTAAVQAASRAMLQAEAGGHMLASSCGPHACAGEGVQLQQHWKRVAGLVAHKRLVGQNLRNEGRSPHHIFLTESRRPQSAAAGAFACRRSNPVPLLAGHFIPPYGTALCSLAAQMWSALLHVGV